METRVLVVGERLERTGLASLLSGQPGYTVVGQIGGEAALPSALELYRPDVVLWDMGWEAASLTERVADLHVAGAQIVALVHDAASAGPLWAGGVSGLLLRDAETDAIVAALGAVAQGLHVVGPALRSVLGSAAAPAAPSGNVTLTAREQEVLRLLAQGLPNKEIARLLAISEHTVKFHINAVLGKLGAQSRTEAVVLAMRRGLVAV
jgi:two-component system, NarL family, nitrate/nitrite response regulator NarL